MTRVFVGQPRIPGVCKILIPPIDLSLVQVAVMHHYRSCEGLNTGFSGKGTPVLKVARNMSYSVFCLRPGIIYNQEPGETYKQIFYSLASLSHLSVEKIAKEVLLYEFTQPPSCRCLFFLVSFFFILFFYEYKKMGQIILIIVKS